MPDDAIISHSSPSSQISGWIERSHQIHVGGDWRAARSGARLEVHDPATGRVISSVPDGAAEDVDAAVAAASEAFEARAWSAMPGAERGALLLRLADLVERDFEDICRIECVEGGNPLGSLRTVDIPKGIAEIRDNAGWASKIGADTLMTPAGMKGLSYTTREPIGVAGIITPWNAPFLMTAKKVSAALAAGCTCVIKPSELTPLSTVRFMELVVEAGFPAGVVNMVTGYGTGAGQALVDHPNVGMISFTGSTSVGRGILTSSARSNFKRSVLELGGKSAVAVLGDADPAVAARAVAKEIVFKSGQYCAAGTRVYVQSAVHDAFLESLRSHMATVTVGHGLEQGVQMGPLISARQMERVEACVARAKLQGARVTLGGCRTGGEGNFYAPTIIEGATAAMDISREEVFGPVLSVERIDESDLDTFVARANASDYGLAAKIWSNDLSRVLRLARRIRAGSIIVNGGGGEGPVPAGGFGASGIGREGGRIGVEAFTEVKSVRIGLTS